MHNTVNDALETFGDAFSMLMAGAYNQIKSCEDYKDSQVVLDMGTEVMLVLHNYMTREQMLILINTLVD